MTRESTTASATLACRSAGTDLRGESFGALR